MVSVHCEGNKKNKVEDLALYAVFRMPYLVRACTFLHGGIKYGIFYLNKQLPLPERVYLYHGTVMY